MKLTKVGKIVNTHGIKGELRIISDFKYKDRVLVKGFTIYINQTPYVINSYRPHKQFDMVTLEGFTNINEVLDLVKKDVYVNISDLCLLENEYIDELIADYIVHFEDNEIGVVLGVRPNPCNPIIEIKTETGIKLIPNQPHFIDYIDHDNKIIALKDCEGLLWKLI